MPSHPSIPAALLCGLLTAAPQARAQGQESRQPVISKVEFLFSMVTHHCHISDRINFYNSVGNPKGNTNYAVPHLVYEPIVTLYNPYNEPLTLTRPRIRLSDPPVGFAFKKNAVDLRADFAADTFHGLARFMISNEFNPAASKPFTLSLSSPDTNGQPGAPIVLQPGESKNFSTWVESNWTWGLETAGGYVPRSFFDWNTSNNFTNRDPRTSNPFGVEAVPTPSPFRDIGDQRAGFQTDDLSQSNGQRPAASLYAFESTYSNSSWVAIKTTDTVSVRIKSMRPLPAGSQPDFQVDLLRGLVQDPASDSVKAFPMSLAGIIQNQTNPVISRTFRVSSILQEAADTTGSGKAYFAAITMIAKSSALRANQFYATPEVPASDLYELQFREIVDHSLLPARPSDSPFNMPPQVHGVSRSGNTLFIDFHGGASAFGTKTWKVRGSSSLANGFTDDLDNATTVSNSMAGSGIYKAVIDISGRGERYFVRIEE